MWWDFLYARTVLGSLEYVSAGMVYFGTDEGSEGMILEV